MTQLYTTYADLYHKMYQSFIDYDEEYNYYKNLVDREGAKTILEIGCGTGQLAYRFVNDGYVYVGIDISDEMLNYARAVLPEKHFRKMDMRSLSFETPFDAVMITARSISYLLTNNDVNDAFRSIKNVLNKNGTLIFDFINAESFIPDISEDEVIHHEVMIDGVKYKRESMFNKKVTTSWNWIWRSTFLKEEQGKFETIGSDKAELRAFTVDEIGIFLKLSGFRVKDILERKVYAFDTRVVIAKRA
ncbi:MAG: class I SAM-dependent DNA methyltransferase [Bacteroidota bacterium]